jgi:hypothetical protein
VSSRTALILLATGLVLGLAVGTTQAAKAKKVATKVEIELGINTGMGTVRFLGDVHSQKSKCEKGRQVAIVYRGPEPGFGVVATTTTDRTGDWELTPSQVDAPDGPYTAEASRKKIKKGEKKVVCKAATSNEVVIAD